MIVACGAIHTPLLLRRNGLGGESGQLGENLAIHPATAVRALFDEEIDMHVGVPQSFYIDEFADEGIMFEGAAGPPDYLATSLPFSRERHRELMLQFRNLAQFGVMVSDLSRGSVRERAGRVEIRYDLCDEDVATVAPRASSCSPSCSGRPGRSGSSCRSRTASRGRCAPSSRCSLMAFHPLGTARADAVTRPRGGGRRPARARRRGALRVRRQRRAELAGREPADHDHGAGHAAGVQPARPGAARG